MKEYTLGLYEKAIPDNYTWEQKLDTAKTCGFDRLEISIDESEKRLARLDNPKEVEEILYAMERTGMHIKTMCLSGHRKYPFGSHDSETRKKSMDIMTKALKLSKQLGIELIQLAGYDVYYEEHDRNTEQWFKEGLMNAVDMAEKEGVYLGFETMETPFMDTVEKAMCYVDIVGSEYLGVYPDIGNLTNAAVKYGHSVFDDIKLGDGHIFAAHLKETKPGTYRNMFFGIDGHTDYEGCVKILKSIGVNSFTAEFWHRGEENPEEMISKASLFLRDKIEKA